MKIPTHHLAHLRTLIAVTLTLTVAHGAPAPLSALMPHEEDHTAMWWAEGFPGVIPDARWKRVVQTGNYVMEQDTETLQFSKFGPLSMASTADLELKLQVDGKNYVCQKGGDWGRKTDPRLIESGRFLQRADVTDLEFIADDDGSQLNVEARFETAAWPDRLGMVFHAKPGLLPVVAGEDSFGKIGGGFGLDGTNDLVIPHEAEIDTEKFTLGFWVFLPVDTENRKSDSGWLLCKNRNEHFDGNYGIYLRNGLPEARMNIGGGRKNAFRMVPESKRVLKPGEWSHLAISYDGDSLRLFVNGQMAGEEKIGRKRVPAPHALAFGRREDGHGEERCRAVIDEIKFYDSALEPELIQRIFKSPTKPAAVKPVREWSFRAEGVASETTPTEQWKTAAMDISLTSAKGALQLKSHWKLPEGTTWTGAEWQRVSLALNPMTFEPTEGLPPVTIEAAEFASKAVLPVAYDDSLGCFKIDLNGIQPIAPPGKTNPSNDAIERINLTLGNPSESEQMARLVFAKSAGGFRQKMGSSITGISAILRDRDGNPTGIPVQLSKNWHSNPANPAYSGSWFHGISQMRLPAGTTTELELTIAYGHWGGLPAASHAQLCLIGWGSNQLWQQSALGSWGESICYETEQAQANCTITDVRPAMVRNAEGGEKWAWTGNVGGGDFLRLFATDGKRVPPSAMRSTWQSYGPCLTEVTHAGRVGVGISHSTTTSLARTTDIVRGVYRIRMDVEKPTPFSRFVIFQIGADTYNYTRERKFAIGNGAGLTREWSANWGGNTYRTEPIECIGRVPWVSLHDCEVKDGAKLDTTANRGFIIRSWKARLGGKDASPWVAEHGIAIHRKDSSTMDIVPPPGITRLEPGDFVEATIEHVVLPRQASDYYGSDEALKNALQKDANTWRMVSREAVGGDVSVESLVGTLERTHPDIRISTVGNKAVLDLTGGNRHVPVTFTGLTSPAGMVLNINGKPLDQNVHGNDFWQTEYDAETKDWSRTYNISATGGKPMRLELRTLE